MLLVEAHDCGFVGSGGFCLEFWISNLFRFSLLGFRISCLVAASGRVKISIFGFPVWS